MALKRPASAALEWAKKAKPPCPNEDDTSPLHCNGGTIYKDPLKRVYRAIRMRGKYDTETRRSWKKGRSEAWNDCLTAIDAYHKK